MSASGERGGARRDGSPDRAGVDDAEPDESGYRRDDYWREEQEGLDPKAVPEPPQGYDFERPERRRGEAPEEERGESGGDEHDRARIVERDPGD